MNHIGIISPGKMGRTLALTLNANGHKTYFASQSRKPETVALAKQAGIIELPSIKNLVQECDTIICIGTQGIAFNTASQVVLARPYDGLYIDFNSLHTPQEEKDWRFLMEMSNSRYVEGALQGYPFDTLPETSDTHLMILSGEHADEAEKLFANTIWFIEKTKRNAKTVNREPF
jgi:3-hydroxyisobutyrate dehydrogenase-like beta-hydroxyacid dehydrogenase